MKKENLLKTSTHTRKETTRNMMKEEKRKEKVNEKKGARRDALVARVLVFIPRARNSSTKLRAYTDVRGK
jgi:hypothetical protein